MATENKTKAFSYNLNRSAERALHEKETKDSKSKYLMSFKRKTPSASNLLHDAASDASHESTIDEALEILNAKEGTTEQQQQQQQEQQLQPQQRRPSSIMQRRGSSLSERSIKELLHDNSDRLSMLLKIQNEMPCDYVSSGDSDLDD